MVAATTETNTLPLQDALLIFNTPLASLSYQGTLNYNGPDTLTVTSRDSNAVTDVDTVAITVNPVNDAPVNTVPGAQVVNERSEERRVGKEGRSRGSQTH